MKKAVIATGGKQYLVSESETLLVEKLNTTGKIDFEPYLVIDGDNVLVGEPTVSGAKVTVEVVDAEVRAPKVMVQKFQSKKRVRSLRGHRQTHSRIKINSITTK